MKERIRVLWIGDGYVPTGFARVNQSIIDNLGEEYDIHHLAINYMGDPHPHRQQMYPASARDPFGDMWGYKRIKDFYKKGIDLIFILNDIWVINNYLAEIKKVFGEEIPPIVAYFPVDSEDFLPKYFQHFDIVTVPVAYTEFGKEVVMLANPRDDYQVIPHGTSTDIFYPITEVPKAELKRALLPNDPDIEDSFIVLNANRNQPRKRIDIAVAGFALFVKDKPANVKYYHHAGVVDVGWNILEMFVHQYGLKDRLILTSVTEQLQAVPDNKLNFIYNATDVGLTTSTGEGWGLTATEHAATGAPQIVGNYTAPKELFEDCGLLLDPVAKIKSIPQLTTHFLTSPEQVAEKLNMYYYDKELREEMGRKAFEKFTSDEYKWENIAKRWDKIFKSLL